MFGGFPFGYSQQHQCCCQCHSQHAALQSAADLAAAQANYVFAPPLSDKERWACTYNPNLTPEQRETYNKDDWKRSYKP